jgi:hypothetical protein
VALALCAASVETAREGDTSGIALTESNTRLVGDRAQEPIRLFQE